MRILFKAVLICFLSIFLFQTSIDAQIFEKLNGPYGGGSKVYEGKNGVLFQILNDQIYDNILYRSVNGGSNWTKMPVTPASVWYYPLVVGLDGNLYAAGSNSKLYKSTNDGQSWTNFNSPVNGIFINYVSALPDGTILVATDTDIFQSTNNGQNWQRSSVSNIDQFFYNSQKDEVYAMNDNSLYVSKDKGLSWNLFFADNFGANKKDLLIAANGNILVSGDEFIWKFDSTKNLIRKLDPFIGTSRQVDMALSATGRLFAFEWYKSFYSDNLGENWIEFGSAGTNKNAYHSFASAKNGALFGVKQNGGLFRTLDNGKTWLFSAQGMSYATIVELDFISDSKIVALTNDGLFYSDDSGQTWTFLISSHEETFFGPEIHHVINVKDEFYFVDYNSIYYFKDSKTAPVVVKQANGNQNELALFVNPITAHLFYNDVSGFYKSSNKGLSWSKLPISNIQSLHAFPDGSMIVSNTNGIFRSSDNGENWNLVFSDGVATFRYDSKILGTSYSGAYVLYIDAAYKIAATVDNGLTWNTRALDPANSNNINADLGQVVNNLDYLFVTGFSGEIFRSVDQGRTFTIYTKEFSDVSGLAISPNQKLYVMTRAEGLHRSKITTSASNVLKGNVFKDANSNCLKDAKETGLANRLIVATYGTKKEYAYSKENGDFLLPIEAGTYDLIVETSNNYWTSCTKSVASTSYNFNDTLHLGLQANSLCPFMKVDIQTSILRRCEEAVIYVNYSNSGTLKAKDAFVDVTLDPSFEFISSSISFSSQNGNVYRFNFGDVDENASGYFSIRVKVDCKATMGQFHCAEAHIYPDTPCVQSLQAIIRTSANCLGDSIDLIIKNVGNANMTAAKNWSVIDLSILSHNIQSFDGGTFYLNAGQVFTKRIASRDRVLFIAEQDVSYPYNKSSKTEINHCVQNPLPGSAPLSINNLDEAEPFISKFCERNRGSFDPNEINGFPEGITDKRYIDNSQELEYIIRFQNTGTDTAFNIRIENEIPTAELDLSTLTLGASSHPYTFSMTPDGKLIFSFSKILLADSSINEKASHGFIQYSIKPINKLSSGTKILNDALIYFDFNDGVSTNVDLHTIGSAITVKLNNTGQNNEIDFQIEPNPMVNSSFIWINSFEKNQNWKLSCMDIHNHELWNESITGNREKINKDKLNAGVYFLILKNQKGTPVRIKKLIVE